MRVSHRKAGVKFHCATVGVLCFIVELSARLQRYSQPIPGNSILRLQLHRAPGKTLSVSKSFRIGGTSTRLDQDYTQSHQRIHVCRAPERRITIGGLCLLPALLIGINIAEPVSSASIIGLKFEHALVSSFGFREPACIAKLISL